MAGGANKSFISDPLKFMQRNVVMVRFAGGETDIPRSFDLVEEGRRGYEADIRAGISKQNARNVKFKAVGAKKVYSLISYDGPVRRNSHPIMAYWCAYKDESVKGVQLGDVAKFMFTPTINGCSMGISGDDPPRVAHANKTEQINGVRKSNQALMDLQLGAKLGVCDRTFKKSAYASEETQTNVTFFGYRPANGWEFYWQSRDGVLQSSDGGKLKTATGFSPARSLQ